MEQVPDAPWIRRAELYGYPDDEPEPVECPVCGEECEEIWFDAFSNVVGCENCLTRQEAYEWAEEQREADRDDS